MFASIRFDTKVKDAFGFGFNASNVNDYITSHMPDSTLGFSDSSQGSDVLDVLESFLVNPDFPVCGARIQILMKRYPNETVAWPLMQKLRQNHTYVSIIASKTPSGGQHPETMYKLTTQANGLMTFQDDSWFDRIPQYTSSFRNAYIIYSVNLVVDGKGSTSLQSFAPPCKTVYCTYMVAMNVLDLRQSEDPQDIFPNVKLTWQNSSENSSGSLNNTSNYLKASNGTLFAYEMTISPLTYNMTLDYDYGQNRLQHVQIRIFDSVPFDHWLPFDY